MRIFVSIISVQTFKDQSIQCRKPEVVVDEDDSGDDVVHAQSNSEGEAEVGETADRFVTTSDSHAFLKSCLCYQ